MAVKVQVQLLYTKDGVHKGPIEVPVVISDRTVNEHGIFPVWLREAVDYISKVEGWDRDKITSVSGTILYKEEIKAEAQ